MKKIILILVVIFGLGMHAQESKETKKQYKPTLKINGRIQYDFEFLKRNNVDNYFNDNEFRRVHFSVLGNVAKNVKYKVETDFAHGELGFRDVYIKYTAGKYGNFAFGSLAEPTSLDMETSSKYMAFFDRAMLTSLQNFRWGSGFHYENFGLLHGKMSLQMAYTNNGFDNEGFRDTSLEDGMNFVARVTGTVINNKEKKQIVHLGINYDSRPYKDLKFRPENHMGSKYHYVFDGADNRKDLGFELGTTFGPISVQGEYKKQTLNATEKDYKMTAYYAFASYFITGEYRPYKHAAFGRVKPKNDIDNGGFGAIEVLARYSSMRTSKDVINLERLNPETLIMEKVNPQYDINNISLGLNWYLNSHMRVMYNYVITDDGNDILGNLGQHLFRVQLDF